MPSLKLPPVRLGYRLAAIAAAAALATPSLAQSPAGEELYLRYCAVCHGLDASGNGPLGDALKQLPSDLTLIAKRAGGKFPAQQVAEMIRSGGGVKGHGSSAMLAWGKAFSADEPGRSATSMIDALVRHLEGIQAK